MTTSLFLLTMIAPFGPLLAEATSMVCGEECADGAAGSAMLQIARKHSPVKKVSKDKEDHTSSSHSVKAKPEDKQDKDDSATPTAAPTMQQMIQEGLPSAVSMPWGHLPAKQAYRQNDQLSSFKEKTGLSGHRHHSKPGLHGSVSYQRCGLQALVENSKAHLEDSRSCLPKELPHKHLSALRLGASLLGHLLATDTNRINLQLLDVIREEVPAAASTEQPEVDGTNAPLDAAGFKAVTSRCCPQDMETFFQRLLASMNLEMCSKPHVQGLMHWFSCAPDMDFQYLVDVVNNGNPCKYWTANGSACPPLSPECEGEWCR